MVVRMTHHFAAASNLQPRTGSMVNALWYSSEFLDLAAGNRNLPPVFLKFWHCRQDRRHGLLDEKKLDFVLNSESPASSIRHVNTPPPEKPYARSLPSSSLLVVTSSAAIDAPGCDRRSSSCSCPPIILIHYTRQAAPSLLAGDELLPALSTG